MIRRFILYIAIACTIIYCKKEEDLSTFTISLKETSPTSIIEFQENILVKIRYEHPEGYVGFSNPDQLSLEIKDSRLSNADYYHLIPVNPPNHTLSVTGEIAIQIDAPFILGNGDMETLTFSLRIQDSNMNWSNKITTPLISVNK